jgi:hypothetical protein
MNYNALCLKLQNVYDMHFTAARLVFFLALILLGSACSSTYRAYSGPKLSSDQIATIVAGDTRPGPRSERGRYQLFSYSRVEIYKVDKKILPQRKRRRVELMPGLHCVGIVYKREYGDVLVVTDQPKGIDLCLDAEPGRTYQAEHAYTLETDKDHLWMFDTENGNIVAGDPPPEKSDRGD